MRPKVAQQSRKSNLLKRLVLQNNTDQLIPTEALSQPLKPRDSNTDLEKSVGSVQVVQTFGTSAQLGYYCQACDFNVKDSISYLDHLNSKERTKNSDRPGKNRCQLKGTEKLFRPSKEKAFWSKTKEKFWSTKRIWYIELTDLNERIEQLRKEDNDKKQRRKLDKKRKKAVSKQSQNKDIINNDDDDELMKTMGHIN